MSAKTKTDRVALRKLPSGALDARLRDLLGRERHVRLEFLVHLEEFDRRRGYERLGYPGLWDYFRHELGLLDCASFRRIHSMRILRRFPQAFEYLRDGRLCMTTLVLLKDVLTEANADGLFEDASGKTKKEVEYLATCMKAPIVDAGTRVQRLPAPAVVEAPPAVAALRSAELVSVSSVTAENGPDESAAASTPHLSASTMLLLVETPRRTDIRPVSAERYRISLTVGQEFMKSLDEARVALSHVVPDGNLEAILQRGLDEVLTRTGKRNGTVSVRSRSKPAQPATTQSQTQTRTLGQTQALTQGQVQTQTQAQPRARAHAEAQGQGQPQAQAQTSTLAPRRSSAERSSSSRRKAIPAEVRREVWERDGGRCAWKRPGGKVCGSTRQLELDHIDPVALGGRTVAANLRLCCRAHNQQAARVAFGDGFMERFGRATSPGRSETKARGPPGR